MSGSPGLSGTARPVIAAQKSAEGIVVGLPTKARTTDRVNRTVRSCGPSGGISSWNWPWSRKRRVKPGAPEPKGPKPAWRVPNPNAQRLGPRLSRSPCSRLNPSNRRVRTRMHGGVGGAEPRGSPLSRLPFEETTHVKIPAVRAQSRRETLSPFQACLWAFFR